MSKKTLLSEAQIRRFMGLAGMESNLVSNVIKEMSYQEDELDPADDESASVEPAMGDEEPMGDEAPLPPEPAMGDEEPMGDGEVSLEQGDVEELKAMFDKVMGQLLPDGGAEMDAEAPMDMDAEAPLSDEEPPAEEDPAAPEDAAAPEDVEAEEDEELAEVSLQLSEEEIVQEVARRVAKRIIKAKRAKKQLDEALGRK